MFGSLKVEEGDTLVDYLCFWTIVGLYLVPALIFRGLRAAINYVDEISRKMLYT